MSNKLNYLQFYFDLINQGSIVFDENEIYILTHPNFGRFLSFQCMIKLILEQEEDKSRFNDNPIGIRKVSSIKAHVLYFVKKQNKSQMLGCTVAAWILVSSLEVRRVFPSFLGFCGTRTPSAAPMKRFATLVSRCSGLKPLENASRPTR